MTTLETTRKTCDSWEEDDGCMEDYPEDCPVATLCKADALED